MSYAAFLAAVASPGPNVLAIMGMSMSNGRSSGIALGLGVAGGSFSWAVLTVFGLTALILAYAPLLLAIKIAGGLYLLWLGFKSLRSAASNKDLAIRSDHRRDLSWFRCMRSGYLVMMTNPKAVLAWVAIVSLGMQEGAPWWVGAIIAAGTTILSTIVHLMYAIVFSTPVMQRAYAKCRRVLQAVMGTFFSLAGLRLLSSP
ncbi:LysE family transporter [uncultured Roseibium sp.]|uniref:LysE family translocator n=1 Tax=uncultured Roseibium sp. TaxID=1936171 RepID=UPI002593FEAA|nr:LysE family transporter [uncultured Roseibium sp.]